MDENEFLELLDRRVPPARSDDVLVGRGDDGAVVRFAGDVVLAQDACLEGVDFVGADVGPGDAVGKAVKRSLSDLAAMGARARHVLVSLGVPDAASSADLRAVVEGLRAVTSRWDVSLLGGDTKRSPSGWWFDVCAVGVVGAAGPFTRRGARPGDALCVTGTLGGSGLGRHVTFEPRLEAGLRLASFSPAERPTAVIDLSDGLARDLRRLAAASGVGARVEAERVPLSEDAGRAAAASGRGALWHALCDGEDYELLFSLPEAGLARLEREGLPGVSWRRIGEVLAAEGGVVLLSPSGRQQPLPGGGFVHRFGPREDERP